MVALALPLLIRIDTSESDVHVSIVSERSMVNFVAGFGAFQSRMKLGFDTHIPLSRSRMSVTYNK